MKKAPDLLEAGAALYRERNAIYGDSYQMAGPVMHALFPNGIKLETVGDHARFSVLSLLVVKLVRYANAWHVGGHSDSTMDSSVYWAILEEIDYDMEGKEIEEAAERVARQEGRDRPEFWGHAPMNAKQP
jgi:hypothetical protein